MRNFASLPAHGRSRRQQQARPGTVAAEAAPFSARRYVLGNGGALLLGLLAAYLGLLFSGVSSSALLSLKTVDFMEYYSAARLILEGHAGHIYDWQTLGQLQDVLTYPYGRAFGVLPYLYPPYFVSAFVPLSALPYSLAYVLWLAIDCLVLTVSMFLLERHAGLMRRQALVFRLAALSFLPVFLTLGLGQASIVLLAVFAGSLVAIQAGKPGVAGVLLAAAFIKPYYAVPFLIVLVTRRQWKTIWTCTGTVLILLAAPLPIFRVRAYGGYIRMLREVTQWQGRPASPPLVYHHFLIPSATYAPPWNHSLAGSLELLMQPRAAELASAAGIVCLLGLLAWCAMRAPGIDLPLGTAVVVALLISPHTLAYDLTLLLIPAAVALRYRQVYTRVLLGILTAGYLMVTAGYRLVFYLPVQLSVMAMLLLLAWLTLAASVRAVPASMDIEEPAPAESLRAVPPAEAV